MNRVVLMVAVCLMLSVALFGSAGPASAEENSPGQQVTSFQVLVSRGREDTIGSTSYYVVEGVIKNTGTTNVKDVYVRARIYWTGDILRGEYSELTDLKILRPGETSSFRVRVAYAAPFTIDYHRVDAIGSVTTEQPRRDLVVVNSNTIIEGNRRFLRAEVQNTGTLTAASSIIDRQSIRLFVIIYDTQGQILKYVPWSSFFGHLNPGQRSPFWVDTSIFDQVGNWEYWIEYDVLPPGRYWTYPALVDKDKPRW